MNKISDQIMEGMKTAMKAKDTVTLNTLRALKTALTNTAIAKGGLGTLLEEAEELAVVPSKSSSVRTLRSNSAPPDARNWRKRKKLKSPSSNSSCPRNSQQKKRQPFWKP